MDDANPLELAKFCLEKDVDLFIGGVKERPIAYKLGIGFCDHNHERKEPLAGYIGMLNFAKEVYASVASPVWQFAPRRANRAFQIDREIRDPRECKFPVRVFCVVRGQIFLALLLPYANVAAVFRTYRNVGFVSAAIRRVQGKRRFFSEFKRFFSIHRLGIAVAIDAGVVLKTDKSEARGCRELRRLFAAADSAAAAPKVAATPRRSLGSRRPRRAKSTPLRASTSIPGDEASPPPSTAGELRSKNFTSTRNACKLCTPLGACLVFRGVEGCIPFLHGSQGCSTYIRRYLISHFREPMDIASSNFHEDSAIFGGSKNFSQGALNITRQYQPQLIGAATTCLTETIGEDMGRLLHELRENHGDAAAPIVHVSTPSYRGTHIDGFHAAVRERWWSNWRLGSARLRRAIFSDPLKISFLKLPRQLCH